MVSLSGGADSSAVASLCASMVGFAQADLGLDGLKRVLGYVPGIGEAKSALDIVRALLTTVYQATQNSSEVTRGAARSVAAALGAPLTSGTHSCRLRCDDRTLWASSGLQRITSRCKFQARTNRPACFCCPHLGALLLSTINRSEPRSLLDLDGDTPSAIAYGHRQAYLRRC